MLIKVKVNPPWTIFIHADPRLLQTLTGKEVSLVNLTAPYLIEWCPD